MSQSTPIANLFDAQNGQNRIFYPPLAQILSIVMVFGKRNPYFCQHGCSTIIVALAAVYFYWPLPSGCNTNFLLPLPFFKVGNTSA
jgi:hypothetical protein